MSGKAYYIFGVFGSTISYFFNGLNTTTITLLILMGLDYITGLLTALIFKNSSKTESGGLDSKVGFVGILKKVYVIILLVVASRIDILLGTTYIKDGVCIAFIVNEIISITENTGLMGIPVPKILLNAIDVLKNKEDK